MPGIEAVRRVVVRASFLHPHNADDRPVIASLKKRDAGVVVVVHSPVVHKGRFYIRADARENMQLGPEGVWMHRTHLQLVTTDGEEKIAAVKFDNRYFPLLSLARPEVA